MLQYAIRGERVRQIFHMLNSLIGVRIVLYDTEDRLLAEFDVGRNSAYCRTLRKRRAFDQRCTECDRSHIRQARHGRRYLIYRCHNGLTEGIVPLHDERGLYLGALVFGQIRMPDRKPYARHTKAQERLFQALPVYKADAVEYLAELLACFGEYLIQNQVIRYREAPWAESLREYIRAHIDESISLNEMAEMVQKSPSFLSHRFKKELGLSPHQYLLRERIRRARRMLEEEGLTVRQTALRLGFSDEFHFSRTFKAHTGYPPSQLRR
jgi:AraC-like DNA-binding protein